MATTFAFELNNKPSRSQTYFVFLRITQNRKLKRIKTAVEVKRKSDFNPKAKQDNWIRSSEPNHKKMNDILSNELKNAKNTYIDLKKEGLATSDKIIDTIKSGEVSTSFLQYANNRTKELYNAGNIGNWKRYKGFCNKLEGFMTNSKGIVKDLLFVEITPSFLAKFEAYLHSLNNSRDKKFDKKLHQNTIEAIFRIFRALVNRAIEIDGFIKPEKNPFMVYKFKSVKTMKEKLNEEEIKRIQDLPLVENTLIWHCRNYFLFSFYCAGIRAGDFIQLRWGDITTDGRLNYTMDKNHKTRDLVLVGQAKDILSLYFNENVKQTDYIFPLLDNNASFAKAITQQEKDTMPPELKEKLLNSISSKNALINKELAKISKLAGIEKKVSFHISRHSFAKIAKDKKVDNNSLKSLLAHSSLRQTETYMGSFDNSVNDKAMETIFENTDNSKEELISLLGKMKPEEIELLLNSIKNKS